MDTPTQPVSAPAIAIDTGFSSVLSKQARDCWFSHLRPLLRLARGQEVYLNGTPRNMLEVAGEIADAKTASGNTGRWTVREVLWVALARGLEAMAERTLKPTEEVARG
jgi:hypothetical protein